jgi:hypothetical protein
MLKSLIQMALKLLRLKLKTNSIFIQASMESMRQIVMYYTSCKLTFGKQKCINRLKFNHVED